MPKAPVMSTTIKKQAEKQEISSTLYDSRIYVDNDLFRQKLKAFKLQINEKALKNSETVGYVSTKYRDFPLGAPLLLIYSQ